MRRLEVKAGTSQCAKLKLEAFQFAEFIADACHYAEVKAEAFHLAKFIAEACQSAVGRTPWSAAGPLASLSSLWKSTEHQTMQRLTNLEVPPVPQQADRGAHRGPGGPPHRKPAITNQSATLVILLAALTSCGYIGDPLPPSLEIPVSVTNLRATQVSDKLVVRYSQPLLTTENLKLKSIEATELRAGPLGTSDFNLDKWAASASRFEAQASKDGVVELELPTKDWTGQEVVVAVRVMSSKQRYSAWSNLVIAPIIVPLTPPANLKAQARADGVLLQWLAAAGTEYRIFRGSTALASATSGEYVDTTAEFDKPYTYQVQAFRKLNEKQIAESLISKQVEITPNDTFPPAAPAGLQLIQGVASIEITWQRSTEPDFKSYKIWRAEGDGPFTPLTEGITQTSHSDRTAARGKKYRYAISAIDNSGNESEQSQPQEFTLPE